MVSFQQSVKFGVGPDAYGADIDAAGLWRPAAWHAGRGSAPGDGAGEGGGAGRPGEQETGESGIARADRAAWPGDRRFTVDDGIGIDEQGAVPSETRQDHPRAAPQQFPGGGGRVAESAQRPAGSLGREVAN